MSESAQFSRKRAKTTIIAPYRIDGASFDIIRAQRGSYVGARIKLIIGERFLVPPRVVSEPTKNARK